MVAATQSGNCSSPRAVNQGRDAQRHRTSRFSSSCSGPWETGHGRRFVTPPPTSNVSNRACKRCYNCSLRTDQPGRSGGPQNFPRSPQSLRFPNRNVSCRSLFMKSAKVSGNFCRPYVGNSVVVKVQTPCAGGAQIP